MPVQNIENKNIKKTEYRPIAGLIGCGATALMVGWGCGISTTIITITLTTPEIASQINGIALMAIGLMTAVGGLAGWVLNQRDQNKYYKTKNKTS